MSYDASALEPFIVAFFTCVQYGSACLVLALLLGAGISGLDWALDQL